MRVTPLRPENAMSGNAYPDDISTFVEGRAWRAGREMKQAPAATRGNRAVSPAEGRNVRPWSGARNEIVGDAGPFEAPRRVLTDRTASVRLADSQPAIFHHSHIVIRGALKREAHVPTAQSPPEEGARLPRAHEHPRRPRGPEAPPGPGPQTSHGLTRSRPAIRPWPAESRLRTAVSIRDGSSARSIARAAPSTAS